MRNSTFVMSESEVKNLDKEVCGSVPEPCNMQTSQQTVRDTELVWCYLVATRLAATRCPLQRMPVVTFQS